MNANIRRRSAVWNYFTLASGEPKKVKCMACTAIMSFKSGSTRNLLRHMKARHPKDHEMCCKLIHKRPALRKHHHQLGDKVKLEDQAHDCKNVEDDGEGDGDNLQLLAKLSSKRKRSEIWLHFSESEIFSKKSSERAKCKHCHGIVSYTGGSTGNLLRHLKNKHPSVQCERRGYLFTSVPNIPASSPNSTSESDASDLLLQSGDMEHSNECPDQNQLDDLKRAINFTLNEKIVLVRLAKKYIRLIECKKMDVLSKEMKQIAWTNIEYEFNTLSRENNRDKKVLRKKYENLKVRVKEKYEVFAKQETPECALSKLSNVERDVIDIVQNCEKYAVGDNQETTVEDPIRIEYLDSVGEEFSSYTDTVEELATIVEEFETVEEHSTSSADVSTTLHEAEYVFSHDENEGIQESELDESLKKDPIDLDSGLESATKTASSQEPSLSPFNHFKNNSHSSKPKRGENFKTTEQMEISHSDMNRWLGSRTKYIKLQKRCLVIEHCQKMKFQAALHKEKMQLIQLQQELLRKQIQVEDQKLRKD